MNAFIFILKMVRKAEKGEKKTEKYKEKKKKIEMP